METREIIAEICDEIKEMLVDKNRKYGDSALNPVRIFSKSSAEEQLAVRMDDKLSRIASGQTDDDEDAFDDLIGYLILRKVHARQREPKLLNIPGRVVGTDLYHPSWKIWEWDDQYEGG